MDAAAGGSATSAGGAAGSSTGGLGSGAGGAGNASGGSSGNVGTGGASTAGGSDGGSVDAGRTANAGSCEIGADCSSGHCVGGVCCALPCDTPGTCQAEEGTTCPGGTACHYGTAQDNAPCTTADLCSLASCYAGQCSVTGPKCAGDGGNDACHPDVCDPTTGACSQGVLSCDDGNPCTKDTCDATLGCLHTDNNAGSCTDGDSCTNDKCTGGVCVSTPVDCSSLTNDCNVGACTNGTCHAQAANDKGACTDGLDACSTTGVCKLQGGKETCVGNDDACGALAASCATCTSGAGCTSGRDCTCQTATGGAEPIIVVNGVCVSDSDECNTNPCSPLAKCVDPTPDGSVTGDYTCTCPSGYTGNGKGASGCTDINECSGKNPCGAGVATNGCNGLSPPGSYSCTCKTGYRSVQTSTGPICACDMSGTYGLVTENQVAWSEVQNAIEASPTGGVTTYSWALRYQTVATNGAMTVTTVPCGGTAPVLCDTAFKFAHAQYQPDESWGMAKMRSGFPPQTVGTAAMANAVPGSTTYAEPQATALMGITLASPSGAWPPCRECVGVAAGATCTCPGSATKYTVTNAAAWWDNAEGTGQLGVTTVDVPRGGRTINGTPPDPPIGYTEPSECPRLATPTATYGYSEWPGLDTNGAGFRAYQWSVASRVISQLKASTVTFNTTTNSCSLAGTIGGPDSGKAHTDGRVEGCEKCKDSLTTLNTCVDGGACTAAEVDSYDDVGQTQQVVSATFTLTKLSTDLGAILAETGAAQQTDLTNACNALRSANCPSGDTCTVP